MNWSFVSFLGLLIILFHEYGVSNSTINVVNQRNLPRVIAPASHVALSGDLTIFILKPTSVERSTVPTVVETDSEHSPNDKNNTTASDVHTEVISTDQEARRDPTILLRILYENNDVSELVGEFSMGSLSAESENTSLVIPCAILSRGGRYELQLRYKSFAVAAGSSSENVTSEIQVDNALQVKWPTPTLALEPQHFDTYPNRSILVTVKYNGISCVPPKKSTQTVVYTLHLIYCGFNVASCDPPFMNRSQILYYEELRGFAQRKVIALRCEFFGLAGDYVLSFRAADAARNVSMVNAHLKVEWSDEFKFNVHARSVYPCEGSGGVPVLFEYPSCRLQGDRVRVYGRLRADVASFAPPSTLHYITELRAAPGKYTLNFDCDVFTEKFVEYCFVYVSEAITGAMAEVRVACIPTFPLQESDAGGWGPWSPWTSCSSSCFGGVRSRYRFCDTPPPSYGAKFCQGKAVESESCGGVNLLETSPNSWNILDWKCRHGTDVRDKVNSEGAVSNRSRSKCRCGCLVNLEKDIKRRVLSANTQACPGRSFWLIQAISNFVVTLHVDQAQFPCPGQYFRVRDGDSLSAVLLTDIAFDRRAVPAEDTIVSSGQSLLLEFYSDEISAAAESCVGGFLVHAAMFYTRRVENGTLSLVPLESNSSTTTIGQMILWTTPAHFVAASLLTFIFFISISLALQFAFKYRKYHLAEDLDNLSDNFLRSDSMENVARLPKTLSSSTLISEVVSLVADSANTSPINLSKRCKVRDDTEDGYESSESRNGYEDESGVNSDTTKPSESDKSDPLDAIIPNKLEPVDMFGSVTSIAAIGQPEVKYARPIKLRTLEPKFRAGLTRSSSRESSLSQQGSLIIADFHAKNSPRNARYEESSDSIGGKDSSPRSIARSGKETKDRRNRERLLQGPVSEYGLTNPEVDLELDYYDYDVANAGAAPGSYLGMDPAFLVWIPPLTSEDSETFATDDAGCSQEAMPSITEIESKLGLENGGLTFTPSEYQRYRLSSSSRAVLRDPYDLTEGSSHSDGSLHSTGDSMERRTKLNERLLSLHRILEDSRVVVSEECLQNVSANSPEQTSISDNRSTEEDSQPFLHNSSKCNRSSDERDDSTNVSKSSSEGSDVQAAGYRNPKRCGSQRSRRASQDERRNLCNSEENSYKSEEGLGYEDEKLERDSQWARIEQPKSSVPFFATSSVLYHHRDVTCFARPCEDVKVTNYINIPMTEISDRSLKEAQSIDDTDEKQNETLSKRECILDSTDTDPGHYRDPFYLLTRDSADTIKFADDDEDDEDENVVGRRAVCIDNRDII